MTLLITLFAAIVATFAMLGEVTATIAWSRFGEPQWCTNVRL